jgi:hypothetical protein
MQNSNAHFETTLKDDDEFGASPRNSPEELVDQFCIRLCARVGHGANADNVCRYLFHGSIVRKYSCGIEAGMELLESLGRNFSQETKWR